MTATLQPPAPTAPYLEAFAAGESDLARLGPSALARARRAAATRFAELGFPGPRDEDWKFTSLTALARSPFRPATPEPHGLTPRHLDGLPGLELVHRLVFVNGFYAPDLSSPPPGLTVCSLADGLASDPERVTAHLGRLDPGDHAFVALNTALFRDGAFIQVAAGQAIDQPVGLTFLAAPAEAGPVASFPRNLVVVERGGMLTLVETYASLSEGPSFTCAVTEFHLAEGAVVDHYKDQEESLAAFHLACTVVHQPARSTFSSHYLGFGGALVRNETRVTLDGPGCETTVNGLYRAEGTQHADNHTVIDHAKPHCNSHELYKGILGGKARGVFNGKIFVREDAQKTDAKQTNKTLLLSDDAVIDTKPQLEIFADDVKCTHGATVGQLDETQLFYLRSRGLGLAESRALLTFAFANDLVGRVKVEPLRRRLERRLLTACHLPTLEVDGEDES